MNLGQQVRNLPSTWRGVPILALDAGSAFATAVGAPDMPPAVQSWTFDQLTDACQAVRREVSGERLVMVREDLGRWRRAESIKRRGLDFEEVIKKLFPPLGMRFFKIHPRVWQAAVLGKKLIDAMRAVDPENATKLASVAAAKARGFATDDHNQADAFNLWQYADNVISMHFQG